jgi:hypothetical protein
MALEYISKYISDILLFTAVTAVINITVPNSSYRRYLSFITGMLLIELLIRPLR